MDVKEYLNDADTRNFLLKLKDRKQWRTILAICTVPSQIGAIEYMQGSRPLKRTSVFLLLKRFVKFKLLSVSETYPAVYTLTDLGKEVLKAYPIDYDPKQVILRGSSR